MKKVYQVISIFLMFSILAVSLNLNYSEASITNNFAVLHFPTVLPSIMLNEPEGLDNKFTDMIKSTGANWVVFEVDAYEVRNSQYAEQRLLNAINYAKSQNLKIHLIYQQNIDHYDNFNLTLPDFTYETFSNWIKENNLYLAHTFIPDRLTIIAEPTLFSRKAHINFSLNQWVELLTDTARAVKQQGYGYSSMPVWVDIIPKDDFDYALSMLLAPKGIINGIGYDVYGVTNFDSIKSNSNYQHIYGKKTGITETWFKDIYTHPEYDNPIYNFTAAEYFNSTYQIAKNNKFNSIYTPFFSEQFVDLEPLPLPFTIESSQAYLNRLYERIGNKTFIQSSYYNLIRAN